MNWFILCTCLLVCAQASSFILSKGSRWSKFLFRSKAFLKCEVGIVGGGFSGLYMAYRLLKTGKETRVCIFEKDSRVGGRIRDFRFEQAPNVHVGLGAWRIDKKHDNMLHLVEELGIQHTEWTFVEPSLHESREIKSSNLEDIRKGYPSLLAHPVFGNMTSNELNSYAYSPENVAKADQYATVSTYFSNIITPEGAKYLSELYGYKGDFTEFISPKGYIEFSEVSMQLSDEYVRPKGGMSSIIANLQRKVENMGGYIFTNTEVKGLLKKRNGYVLILPHTRVKSKKLILAVNPEHLKKIKGYVARKIQGDDRLHAIQPVPAFKGAAVYENAWWENLEVAGTPVKPGQKFISYSNCLGTSMAHRDKGLKGEGVLHTMYSDGDCARKWNDIATMDKNYIDVEVHRALETKYGIKIPKPLNTSYQYWDSAWHFQKAGTPFTMVDISNWAKRPLNGLDLFVVGEAYNPMRGWCEGAIVSSKNALQEGWGIQMDEKGLMTTRNIETKADLSRLMLSKRIVRP